MLQFLSPRFRDAQAYEDAFLQLADDAAFAGPFARAFSDGRKYGHLEAYPLTQTEWGHLQQASESAFLIAQKLTTLAIQGPDSLLDAINLMPEYRPWLRSSPPHAPFSRFARIDWVRDEAGNWHLLEFNAREPGGLPEIDFCERVFALYRDQGIPVHNPNSHLASMLRTLFQSIFPVGGRIGFCTVPGYVEDYENALAAAILWEGAAVFGGWPTVDADGTVRVCGQTVQGLYLYLPSEEYWRYPGLLERLAQGDFPVVNPGSALIMQDKKSLALAHQLCELGQFWSPLQRAWIERFIPYTSVAPFEGDWVAKPAWAREGAGVFFGAGLDLAEPEYVYQRRILIERAPLPIWTVRGPVEEAVTPIVGVYLVDGKPAGVLTRVGGPVTDQSAHFVPTFVLT